MQNTAETRTAERTADMVCGNTIRYCIQAHTLVINIKEKYIYKKNPTLL